LFVAQGWTAIQIDMHRARQIYRARYIWGWMGIGIDMHRARWA
jgi:hypothetical protein